ncbi:uncharacterized protein LOC141590413 [Silene latifolia]|uniref:uncharacterized protein LOC141590413 n=1 Tax=Silene latifolia TaxID=37657 RepID=UPI003D78107D
MAPRYSIVLSHTTVSVSYPLTLCQRRVTCRVGHRVVSDTRHAPNQQCLSNIDARIWNDYFSNDLIYTNNQIRRRFRMCKELFLRIVNALENHDTYFKNNVDGIGRNKISSIKKFTVAIGMLAYGMAGDAVDGYVRMAGKTAIQCLKKINECVIDIFGGQYLRKPTIDDIERLLHVGSNNDINVLDCSPIFDEFLEGRGPNVQFTVNGSQYNMGYYLADDIYPEWHVFVKTIPRAHMLSEKSYLRNIKKVREKMLKELLGCYKKVHNCC